MAAPVTGAGAAALAALLVGAPLVAGTRAVAGERTGAARRRLRAGRAASAPGAPAWFVTALHRLELNVDADRAWPVGRAGGVLGALLVVATVPPVAPIVVVGAAVALWLTPGVQRRRRERAFDQDLPGVIEAMVAELATGASLGQALARISADEATPGGGLGEVVAGQRRGASIQAGLDRWAEDRPGDGPSLVADAIALAGSSGGSQAGALAGAAATLRERQALRREVAALASQARASAWVLVVVPAGFAALVAVADHRIGRFMLATPIGWACVAGGLVFDGVGAWWMHRLTGTPR